MSKIALVTDSIACLPADLIALHDIEIIPMNILVAGKVYRDWVDMNPAQAYELFLKDPENFKAAPPTPEDCYQGFLRASRKADQIICVTVSEQISTIVNMARRGAERVLRDRPELKIEILDSSTATAAEGFVVLAAARAAAKGASPGEALQAAREVKSKVNVIAFLDTVKYVYRSGRVPKIAAQAGSVLNIKPIFTISGSVHFSSAVISHRSGVERMIKMMAEKVDRKPVHCAVMHAYDLKEAELLKERVARQFDCVELWITEFSPLMGYATGTGTLALAFYLE